MLMGSKNPTSTLLLKSFNIYEIESDHNTDEPDKDVEPDPNANDLEQDDYAQSPSCI